ncbi:MAG: TnsA endonuclease N-terminal domain-containing protein [Clostridia bacterium]|nr:TnsA endonuclease N-terminal domain-containing protein [Clostridia bacterium]
MGKRRARWDEKRYIRDLKNGVSQGTGADYIPGISIHDFPSKGISSRIYGHTTGRIHHCLSRYEEYYFIILDHDPDVLDIREQFWLRLSETLEIASRLNIRHPRQGNFPSPISTDFLVTRRDGIHARTVKESKELENPRILEKFSIEFQYWKEKGVDWKVVTENEINRDLARNLQWLHSGSSVTEIIPDAELRKEASALLLELFAEKQFSFSSILEIVEEGIGLSPGAAIALFKDLVLAGCVSLDLSQPINFMDPLAKED